MVWCDRPLVLSRDTGKDALYRSHQPERSPSCCEIAPGHWYLSHLSPPAKRLHTHTSDHNITTLWVTTLQERFYQFNNYIPHEPVSIKTLKFRNVEEQNITSCLLLPHLFFHQVRHKRMYQAHFSRMFFLICKESFKGYFYTMNISINHRSYWCGYVCTSSVSP